MVHRVPCRSEFQYEITLAPAGAVGPRIFDAALLHAKKRALI